jgi:hypothetical protein
MVRIHFPPAERHDQTGRSCDAFRKWDAIKKAFADQVASDKGKFARGVVSFILFGAGLFPK